MGGNFVFAYQESAIIAEKNMEKLTQSKKVKINFA